MTIFGPRLINGTSPILMVDDSPIDVTIAKKYYQRSSLTNPLIVFSGGEAFLEHMDLVKYNEVEYPGMVLLDINMPNMDGFDVLRALRSQPFFSEVPPSSC
ncbi:response regulator [Cerasicoccus frondis]|uniref:response regulator n=1 Tax=Cerasicoccus frondis TaxID=490090 RepID=UPI0028527A89|nr:response regulator [Cerasicoccus frondis]